MEKDLDQREEDIQKMCIGILHKSINSTGDYGSGGECPFCFVGCSWDADISQVKHDPECIYLIAKDLSTVH